MAKHLKLFETTAAYEAAESSLILPNVSVCLDMPTTVYYNPFDPYNGHEYVDLGLPSGTKWATKNIGANSEAEYGKYYGYGKGERDYSMTSGETPYTGTENPLASSADTATQLWGSKWHIPTREQFKELTANTNCELLSSGYKFINKNDSSKYIILPYSGFYNQGSTIISSRDSRGTYMSSNSLYSDALYIYTFEFVKSDMWNNGCDGGYDKRNTPIRPVTE